MLQKFKELSRKKSIKDFTAIAGSHLLLHPVSLAKSFLVAKYLGPSDYGILKTTELITMLNKFGNMGFRNVATREIGTLDDSKHSEQATQIRNTAYTAEAFLSILLTIAGIIAGFVLSGKWILIFSLASFGLLANKIRAIYNTEAVIQRKFKLIAKVTFITGLLNSILVASTVPFLQIYAALTIPVLISAGALFYYRSTLGMRYSFKKINKVELKRQLKIGIPLSIDTLAFGSYLYTERTLIIKFLGLTSLGYFGFATMMVNQVVNILLSAVRVRTMDIYKLLGKKQYNKVNRLVLKETGILIAISLIAIPALYLIISWFVPLWLDKYVDAIVIAKIFLLIIPFKTLSSYPNLVLKSSTVNKQNIMPFVNFGAAIVLASTILIFKYFGNLTLQLFVIIDVCGYAITNLTFVILYLRFFYFKFCRVHVV